MLQTLLIAVEIFGLRFYLLCLQNIQKYLGIGYIGIGAKRKLWLFGRVK